MLDTIKALCALDGVSGTEDKVADYIRERVAPYANGVRTDAMGNLIVFKKGRKTPSKSVMLTAHMDEVGLIVTQITDDGYLRFNEAGGLDRRVLFGKTVYVGENRVFGVVGNKAVHLMKREDRDKIPAIGEMYIDIGAKDRPEASKRVSPGDTAAFDPSITEFGDGYIKAKALDDRAGCALLIGLIESELPVDCTFVFAVQEEVGSRGAFAAAFSVAPDIALIVETATSADLPSAAEGKRVTRLDKGVVIPFMDRGTIYNRELFSVLTGLAEKNGIPWQTKTMIAGGTDAGVVQRSRAGVAAAAVAMPVRSLHSPGSVGCMRDYDAMARLTSLFLEDLGARY